MSRLFDPRDLSLHSSEFQSETVSPEPTGVSLQKQFGHSGLSLSLALISYSADCGYSEEHLIPQVLSRLRVAIQESLHYCTKAERSCYLSYVRQLSERTEIIISKLLSPAVVCCLTCSSISLCQLIIQELYDFVTLVFQFANPYKAPEILFDDSEDGNSRLKDLAMEQTYFVCLLKKLRSGVEMRLSKYEQRKLPENRGESNIDINATPADARCMWLTQWLGLLNGVIKTFLKNTTPSYIMFRCLQNDFQSPGATHSDLRYLFVFLGSLEDITSRLGSERKSRFFEFHRRMIRLPLLKCIESYRAAKYPVYSDEYCNNYLELFVEVFNAIYGSNLKDDFSTNDYDLTPVEKSEDESVEGMKRVYVYEKAKLVSEHSCFPPEEQTSYLTNLSLEEFVRGHFGVNCKVIHWNSPPKSYNDDEKYSVKSGSRKNSRYCGELKRDTHTETPSAGQNNESDESESQFVFFRIKLQKCLKCKILPWHYHTFYIQKWH